MEIDYRIILGVITVVMVLYGYYAYIRDILKGTTKPHLFTWIIFFILDVITCIIQYNGGAGAGAWGTFATTVVTLVVMLLTLKYGDKHITKSDTITFIGALIALILYIGISDPTYSLIIVIIIMTLAIYPTMRKSYYKPQEETMAMYNLALFRSLIGIFATTNISFLTIGVPVQIIIANTLLIVIVYIRKKQLKLT